MLGLTLAFDRRTLTDYFAGRLYTISILLVVKKLATAFVKVKSAFALNFAFAPIAA